MQDSLDVKLAATLLEQVFETGAKHVHDADVEGPPIFVFVAISHHHLLLHRHCASNAEACTADQSVVD